MDLLGNLANLKVDTVLSAVDKYVPGKFQLLEVQTPGRARSSKLHPQSTCYPVQGIQCISSIKHCSA
jgi:hypothetical protein